MNQNTTAKNLQKGAGGNPPGARPEIAPEKTAAPEAAFVIKETRLIAEIGGGRDRVRELRTALLTEGVHWMLLRGRVYLSLSGAERLRQNKNWQPSPATSPGAGTPNAAQARAVKGLLLWPTPAKPFDGELIVWRVPRLNQRLLVAYLPGTNPQDPNNLVAVRVQSNLHFMTGEQITAQRVNDKEFNLIGPCPRVRGELKRKKKPAVR